MSKYLPWAVLALVVAGSVYGYTEIRASEAAAKERASRATDRADSLSATNDSLREGFEEAIREYSAYSARAEREKGRLAERVDALTSEAGRQGQRAAARTERLEATLDSLIGASERPVVRSYAERAGRQLDSVRTSHERQVASLRSALAAKDSVLRWTRTQLDSAEALLSDCRAGWGQCRTALDTTRIAVERWRDIADPGWLEQLAKCLPETGAKLAVVGGAYMVEPKAGAGAGTLFALDLALGGPC